MAKALYLSVVEGGVPAHPRYRVADGLGRFWTGTGWSNRQHDAVVFESNQQASFECQQLMMTDFMDARVRRFRAPVYVDVFCDEGFTSEQLRTWLARAARLSVDYRGAGSGPLDGSLGVLQIEWGQIEEQPS